MYNSLHTKSSRHLYISKTISFQNICEFSAGAEFLSFPAEFHAFQQKYSESQQHGINKNEY